MLNKPFDSKSQHNYDDGAKPFDTETNNERFIQLYIKDHKDCKGYNTFKAYIDNRIKEVENKNAQQLDVAKEFVSEFTKLILNEKPSLSKDISEPKYIKAKDDAKAKNDESIKDGLLIKFEKLDVKKLIGASAWNYIAKAIKIATRNNKYDIKQYIIDNNILSFIVYDSDLD